MVLCFVAFVLALLWWLLMSLDRFGRPFRHAASLVQGHLLEVLLYGAFPRVLLRSLLDVAKSCARLSWALLKPSLWFTLPLLVGVAITSGFYAHRALKTGELVLVTLRGASASDWELRAAPQVEIEVDRFRHPTEAMTLWRVRPLADGAIPLVFVSQGKTVEKTLQVGRRALLSDTSYPFGASWLLTPLAAPLPASAGLDWVRVDYPERVLAWHGWSAPWWLLLLMAFLGWSWLLALAPSPSWTRSPTLSRVEERAVDDDKSRP